MTIGSIENHRAREEGTLVYPVYSRRSQGISLGINLFPDAKRCSFHCPYCEVFPFKTDQTFSLEHLETDLRAALSQAKPQALTVKDLCFSGNGEPTAAPLFPEALEAAARIRDELAPEGDLVLITNGTGLLIDHLFDFLCHAAGEALGLKIWLKLDAGSPEWYGEMARSAAPYSALIAKIKEAAARMPFTIQTMLCKVKGREPPPEEIAAWETLVADLTRIGTEANPQQGNIRDIQLYGKARPAPEDPLAEALPPAYLEFRAASLQKAIKAAGLELLIRVFP